MNMEPIFVNHKNYSMIVAVPSGGQVTLMPGECIVGAKFGVLASEDILVHISQYKGALRSLKNPLGIPASQFEFPPKREETVAEVPEAPVEPPVEPEETIESDDYVGDEVRTEEDVDDYADSEDPVFMGKPLKQWAKDIEEKGDSILDDLTSANLKEMGQLIDVPVYGNKSNSLEILKREFINKGWMQ
jgi:hypothetical protein